MTVQILLKYGADPNIQNNDGKTALMYLCIDPEYDSKINTCKLLLDNGANINLQDKLWKYCVDDCNHYSKYFNKELQLKYYLIKP